MAAVRITGLESTKQALRLLVVNFRTIRGKALSNFARGLVTEAKAFCPRDTGALQDSIGHRPLMITKDILKEEVYAGHRDYVRGAGSYTQNKKGGIVSTKISTEEYAHMVERGHRVPGNFIPGVKFMEQTFNLGKSKITRHITNAINDAIRSTI